MVSKYTAATPVSTLYEGLIKHFLNQGDSKVDAIAAADRSIQKALTDDAHMNTILATLNKQDKFSMKAKKVWSRMFKLIYEKEKDIPLLQMALKAKHEKLLYNQIQKNFTRGIPINSERRQLANLNENMKFAGGPTDKLYAKKVIDVAKHGYIKQKEREMIYQGKRRLAIREGLHLADMNEPLKNVTAGSANLKKKQSLARKSIVESESKNTKMKKWDLKQDEASPA